MSKSWNHALLKVKPFTGGTVVLGFQSKWKRIKKKWQLYFFLAPAVTYFLIFHYYPMYGLQIAFKDYMVSLGIAGSPWVGFDHFERFFHSYYFWTLLKNTLLIQLFQLAMFPVAIIVALSINEATNMRFKKWVQTVTYAPHFISVVVMVGVLLTFLNPNTGIINHLIRFFGGQPIAFMVIPEWFKFIYVLSGEWQNLGWGAIIYLAALAAVNPELIDAARVDGATRLQRIFYINIPSILPTIIILFILNLGNLMTVGFEKIYLMQNPLNLDSSDIIQTYVYRNGLLEAQYSFTAAIGLFNNMINFIVLVLSNQILRKTGTSLW